MDIGRLFKKEYVIGLDIGSASVKLAQFAVKEGAPVLIRADLKEFTRNENKEILERETLSAIKDLLKGINIKASRFMVSIDSPKTEIKRIQTPYMPESELKSGILLEAKSFFHFSIDDSLIDFQIVKDTVESGVRKYEVVIAVSPRETVDWYLALLKKLGVTPSGIVPSSYALAKTAEMSYAKEGENTCFIDMGELYTELVIFKGKDMAFSRKIPISGGDFTREMTGVVISDKGKTNLSLEEAERVKREIGIPKEGDSDIMLDKISSSQVLGMLRSPLEQLANEITRCFQYYREAAGTGSIDTVVLFGGAAVLKGLTEFLNKELGVKVSLGDALKGINIAPDAKIDKGIISYRAQMAIGAALGGNAGYGKAVNILPPEIKEETERTVRRSLYEGIAAAVILILAFLYIGMRIQLTNYEKRIETARLELASLRPQVRDAESQYMEASILADEPFWEEVFKELSNLVPADIYITELSMDNKILNIKGAVGSEESEGAISDFIVTLEKGLFNNVRLVNTRDLVDSGETAFELECWVDTV